MRILLILIVIGFITWGAYQWAAPQPTVPPQAQAMSEAEQNYYLKIFDYVMNMTNKNQSYPWKTYSANGTISAGPVYISKSRATCREFKENFVTGGKAAAAEGIACKRDNGEGWCHLRSDQVQTCAMEAPSSGVEWLKRKSDDTFESGKGLMGKAQGLLR